MPGSKLLVLAPLPLMPVFSQDDDDVTVDSFILSIVDMPPEVLTVILEHLLELGEDKKTLLSYRLVNSKWRDIISSILEKRMVSGVLQPFPELWFVDNQRIKEPYVRCSPTLLSDCGNQAPFNSLLLKGQHRLQTNFWLRHGPQLPMMYLPDFVTRVGSNLTFFSFQNREIELDILATVLGSMPCLKRLSLANVKLTNNSEFNLPGAVIPSPPPLPNLTMLSLKAESLHDMEKWVFLCLWLTIPYADQLVELKLDTYDFIPALRQRHNYLLSVTSETTITYSTKDSAFRNLSKLEISRPNSEFLRLSSFPALKSLSIRQWISLISGSSSMDLTTFIVNCRNTLEKLLLDSNLVDLFKNGLHLFPFLNWQPSPLSQITLPSVPFLKTLGIPYPKFSEEGILKRIIRDKFPALTVLQLLRFRQVEPVFVNLYEDESEYSSESDNNREDDDAHDADNEDDDDLDGSRERQWSNRDVAENVDDLKERLLGLTAQLASLQLQEDAAKTMIIEQFEQDHDYNEALVGVNNQRMVAVRRHLISAKMRLHAALKRLTAMGENRDEILVRQMLKRQGVWNLCGNLQLVSVSSGATPDGDVCILRRSDTI